jgi:hypothetical protein
MAGLDPSPPGRPKGKYNDSAPASEDRARRRAGALRSSTESGRLPYWPRGPPLARSIWIFLDRRGFAPGRPENKAWISLDFLGFSRPNRDFSMGYAGFSAKKISRALLPLGRRRGTGAGIPTMQKCIMAHRASLTHFLLFCNCHRRKLSILCRAATVRFRGLSAIISHTSLNQLDGKSLNWVLSKVSPVVRQSNRRPRETQAADLWRHDLQRPDFARPRQQLTR